MLGLRTNYVVVLTIDRQETLQGSNYLRKHTKRSLPWFSGSCVEDSVKSSAPHVTGEIFSSVLVTVRTDTNSDMMNRKKRPERKGSPTLVLSYLEIGSDLE